MSNFSGQREDEHTHASKASEGAMSCDHYMCHHDKLEGAPTMQERREILRTEVEDD